MVNSADEENYAILRFFYKNQRIKVEIAMFSLQMLLQIWIEKYFVLRHDTFDVSGLPVPLFQSEGQPNTPKRINSLERLPHASKLFLVCKPNKSHIRRLSLQTIVAPLTVKITKTQRQNIKHCSKIYSSFASGEKALMSEPYFLSQHSSCIIAITGECSLAVLLPYLDINSPSIKLLAINVVGMSVAPIKIQINFLTNKTWNLKCFFSLCMTSY